ncbi:twin-arginine translocase TatA/TatE family subunit [Patescibacteria group bacterium]
MFKNLGWPEIAIIVVVLLVLFGANFLPKMGKNLGESEKEIKKAAKDFKEVVTDKKDK